MQIKSTNEREIPELDGVDNILKENLQVWFRFCNNYSQTRKLNFAAPPRLTLIKHLIFQP